MLCPYFFKTILRSIPLAALVAASAPGCGLAVLEDSAGDDTSASGTAATDTSTGPTLTTSTSDATSQDGPPPSDATAGEVACDQTTGNDMCDTCEADVFLPEPYASVSDNFHGACTLTGVTSDPDEMVVALQCQDTTRQVRIRQTDLMPDFEPWIGAAFDVDLESHGGDIAQAQTWVSLRREGQVVYASAHGDRLIPDGAGADVYAPMAVAKWSETLCAPSPTGQEESGDNFGCELAAFTALEFTSVGQPPSILHDKQSNFIHVAGGDLRIQVRRSVEGTNCFPDIGPGPIDRFAFSITFLAD